MIEDWKENQNRLAGKFLIASPYYPGAEVFNKSLIYMVSHSHKGAMGLAVNNMVNKVTGDSLLDLFHDTDSKPEKDIVLPIYLGGPVEQERGFILHTMEKCEGQQLIKMDGQHGFGISSNIEILRDIVKGDGPKQSIFMLGYSGWSSGQLEEEIEKGMWLVADSSSDVIFSDEKQDKWGAALESIGIDKDSFNPNIGNC